MDRTKTVYRRFYFGYAIFVLFLVVAVIYAGPITQFYFGHDIDGLAEGGWKILHGGRPYLDFFTIMGPLTHLIMALGIVLAGPNANAFPVSVVVTLIPVALVSWRLASDRLKPFTCFLVCSYLCLVWVGPYPLHFDFWETSYAMIYNRQSSVMLSLACLVLLVPSRRNIQTQKENDGFTLGLLIALIFFFKITYFVAFLIFLSVLLFLVRFSRKEIIRTLLGFSLLAIPMFFYLGGISGMKAMCNAYRIAAQTRESAVIIAGINLVVGTLPGALICIAIGIICLVERGWKSKKFRNVTAVKLSFNPLWIEFFAVMAAAIFAEMGGSATGQRFDVPLLSVYSLVLLDRFLDVVRLNFDYKNRITILGMVCCLFISIPLFMRSVSGMAYVVRERRDPINYSGETVIDTPGFWNLRMVGPCGEYPEGISYAAKVNDGLVLLRRHPNLANATIATLDFSDAFSFPLQKVSPPHMPLGWLYGVGLNEKNCPAPEYVFSKCDIIMVPRYYDDDQRTVPCLLNAYHDYLKNNFTQVDQSRMWLLLVKK